LVAYYSRTDTTKKAAEAISKLLSSDVERIVDKKNRLGIFGYIAAGRDAKRKDLTEIEDPKKDPARYDLVVIGTPIWASTVSTPVRTYLTKNGGKIGKIAFFCTCGGNRGNAFEVMESLCGKKPLATLELTKAEVTREEHLSKVRAFVDDVSAGS
jgi:flavodoxin